jgi:hypothetical protein
MFSDHVKKVNRFPQAGMLILAGGLVIVCQLVAMAMVADQQVQRASVRDLQRVTQQTALADCIQRSTGSTRHICIRQSQLDADINSGVTEIVGASPANDQTFTVKNIAIADEVVTNPGTHMMRVGVAAAR